MNNFSSTRRNRRNNENLVGGSAAKAVGSKAEVFHGTARHTSGGLYKKDLVKTKRGRIVSRRKQAAGKKAIARLRKAGYIAKKGKFTLFTKKSKRGGSASGFMPEQEDGFSGSGGALGDILAALKGGSGSGFEDKKGGRRSASGFMPEQEEGFSASGFKGGRRSASGFKGGRRSASGFMPEQEEGFSASGFKGGRRSASSFKNMSGGSASSFADLK
jgi:hypothetical protein